MKNKYNELHTYLKEVCEDLNRERGAFWYRGGLEDNIRELKIAVEVLININYQLLKHLDEQTPQVQEP
jgi:hypothetical protein